MSQSRSRAARRAESAPDASGAAGPGLTAFAAWCVPGAGHALQQQGRKAAVFFVTLLAMFVAGLAFGGRLFPLQLDDPLMLLAGLAEWALLGPRAAAAVLGAGQGDVIAITYEYGNAFLIAGGLLNLLVALDAMDLASGRKPR